MASILASATAPYVSTVAGVLMPVQKIHVAGTLSEQSLERIIYEVGQLALEPIFQGDLVVLKNGTVRRATHGDLPMDGNIAVALESATIGKVVPVLREGIVPVRWAVN